MKSTNEIYEKAGKFEFGEIIITINSPKETITKLFLVDNEDWEHVCIVHANRLPEYEELVRLKEEGWNNSEIAIQVHPPKAEYVNNLENALHLWRYKFIDPKNEGKIRTKILEAYKKAQKAHTGEEKEILLSGEQKILAIFGDKRWPTWEEVCKAKQKYWEPEEAAVQFNMSYEEDMNEEFCILLWDAQDMLLPPTYLV